MCIIAYMLLHIYATAYICYCIYMLLYICYCIHAAVDMLLYMCYSTLQLNSGSAIYKYS